MNTKELSPYMNIAENNFHMLCNAYNKGAADCAMLVVAHDACNNYLRHIVNKYRITENNDALREKSKAIDAYCCKDIADYIESDVGFQFSPELTKDCIILDAFWMYMRSGLSGYWYRVKADDIKFAYSAVCDIRNFVLDIENSAV